TFSVTGGATFTIAATSYSGASGSAVINLFAADGAGSRLNFASLKSLTESTGAAFQGGQANITATNSGVVDLSGLQNAGGSVIGFGTGTHFAPNGGTVKLDSLASVSGGIVFDALAGNTLALPKLTALDGITLNIADNATVNAPLLKKFSNSILT